MVESTAADRAAADMQRVGREKAAMTFIIIAAFYMTLLRVRKEIASII